MTGSELLKHRRGPTPGTRHWENDKPMRKLATLVALPALLAAGSLSAQQDAQYTNFMNNKLYLSPAVAGSKGQAVVYGLIRKQWFGLEGSPASQAVGFHTPLKGKNAGVGAVVTNDEIGFTRATQVTANYAYHVQVSPKTYLSAGVSASARQYRVDWTAARAIDQEDFNIPDADQGSSVMANFGAGAMLYSDRFYASVSAPRLMRNRLDLNRDGLGVNQSASREDLHLYAMGGVLLPLTSQWDVKPAALVKYATDSPLDVDVHASLIWRSTLTLGATYRTGGSSVNTIGESVDVLASIRATERLRIGTAYDFTLSEIKEVSSGSAELFVEWTLGQKGGMLTNPRFF